MNVRIERVPIGSALSIDLRLVMAGMFFAALIPLFVTPVLPLIDLYNHIARIYVLAHIGTDSLLQQHYQENWRLLPDIGLDAIALPVLRLVPPLVAAKIIVTGILAILYSGVLYFHRALTGQRSLLVAALLLPLLYSYILNWGFANFLLGLGVAFWAAGWWLLHRDHPAIAVPISCVLSLLIYLCHGVTFALYGVLLISVEIGIFINMRARRRQDLLRALLLLAIQAVIPTILFILWEVDHNQSAEVAALTSQGAQPLIGVMPVPHNGLHRLSTIVRVEEGPAYWFDAMTIIMQFGAILFLMMRRNVMVVRSAWLLLAIAGVLIAITPSSMMGIYYIGDRIPLFAALCLVGSLSTEASPWTRQGRIASGVLVAVVVVRLAAITLDWSRYEGDFQQFRAVAAKIPPATLMLDISVASGHHETGVPRCEMYGPLLVSLYGQILPLFSDKSQHPLLLTGDLARARDALQLRAVLPSEMTKDYNPYMSAVRAAGYRMILICNKQLLARPFPQDFALVAETEKFALLRAK